MYSSSTLKKEKSGEKGEVEEEVATISRKAEKENSSKLSTEAKIRSVKRDLCQ